MDFPRLVYRCPGPDSLPGGRSYDRRSVGDQEAFDAAIDAGWFPSVPEAMAGRVVEAEPAPIHPLDHDGDGRKGGSRPQSERDDPPTRAELEQKAKELHIKFDGRTTDHSLKEKIDKALK